MKNKARASSLLALLAGLAPVVLNATATPTTFEGNGHSYEVVAAPGVTWEVAKAAAAARFVVVRDQNVYGHLATITTGTEDQFIEGLRVAVTPKEVWVGGRQVACALPSPGCGWIWDNGEGAIAPPAYTNWQAGEPNDAGGPEIYLGVGLGNTPGWNDERNVGNIGGYIVEYDIPIDAAQCATPAGCEIVHGQTLTYAPNSVPPGGSIGVTTQQITDLDSRCGVAPLPLFFNSAGIPQLVIPPYLCGSPDFLVVKTTPSFDVKQGVVQVENDLDEVLPGNFANGCELPITGDPQLQTVVIWQTGDPSQMEESFSGASSTGFAYAGSAGEFTTGCGSGRGVVRSASYHVIGGRIAFGPYSANLWNTNPRLVVDGFVALTRYKLDLLGAALLKAKNDRVISNKDYLKHRLTLDAAVRQFDRRQYALSWLTLQLFSLELQRTAVVPTPFNHDGDLRMRTVNIIFMIQEKVFPLTR